MGSAEKKGTIKAILIMIFSMIMSRGLGFIRTWILARYAGGDGNADAYAFAFLLPDLLNQILAGAALSVTFIPLFQSLEHDKDAQNRFFSNLFWIGSGIFIIGITAMTLFTPQLISIAGGDNIKSPEVFALTVKLTRIILPAQLFFFWGALLNGAQYANKKFFLPSLAPVMYNLGIIVGGIFAFFPGFGIETFAYGVVAGAFLGNVGVQLFGTKKLGLKLHNSVNLKDKLLKEWIIKTFPLIFSLGLTYSNELMGRIFGARSDEGTGALASINYAYRLFMIFVGLFGQAFASGVYPFLSKLANSTEVESKRFANMEELLFTTLTKTAVFTVPASVLMYSVRFEIVSFLFQGGAFTAEATELTSKALAGYLPGMFFFSAVLLINRLFFALKQTYTTLFISLATLGITIPLYNFIGLKMGVYGIGLIGSAAAILSFSFLLIRWKQIYPQAQILNLLKKVAHIIAIALISGGISYAIGSLELLQANSKLALLFKITVQTTPALIFAFAYFHFSGLLNIKSLLKRR